MICSVFLPIRSGLSYSSYVGLRCCSKQLGGEGGLLDGADPRAGGGAGLLEVPRGPGSWPHRHSGGVRLPPLITSDGRGDLEASLWSGWPYLSCRQVLSLLEFFFCSTLFLFLPLRCQNSSHCELFASFASRSAAGVKLGFP
jgi:hypothetical protein